MNIDDYLKYYKNFAFDEVLFNEMDNILFCTLSYAPLNKIDLKETDDFSKINQKLQKLNKEEVKGLLPNKSIELIKQITNSKRYKNIRIINYINILDNLVQFTALTFKDNDNAFVAFKGTDNSVIGWKENFNLCTKYPTETQEKAIDYLNNVKEKNIYVGGHSKGGNLAMASSMSCKDEIFNRIKHIYNNDGPGFLLEEFNSKEFKRMNKKLTNFLPEGSMVGILLNNKNYTYVISKSHGMYQHDLTSWLCFGIVLKRGKLSKTSKKLQDDLTKEANSVKREDMQILVDSLFNILDKNNVKELRDIKKLNFTEIYNVIAEITNVPEKAKSLFISIVKNLLFS